MTWIYLDILARLALARAARVGYNKSIAINEGKIGKPMSKVTVCFCYPFVKPREPSTLVLFCEPRDAVPEDEVHDYLKKCMAYAKNYSVHLMSSPFIMQGRLCLCLFDDGGRPLAIQKATHLNLLHHAALDPGGAIQVADTSFGKVALLAGVDVFHPEVARAAVMQGAEILLCAEFFDLYDLNPIRDMSGCWSAAQENQVHVAGVSNQNCCVCAPCPVTQNGSGFILAPQNAFPAIAVFYTHKTQKLQQELYLPGTLNPEFCARYAAQLSL